MKAMSKGIKIASMMGLLLGVALGGVFITYAPSVASMQAIEMDFKSVVPSEVCMVNDKVFGRQQIPVEFEGKTYYGCCQGCVGRIKNDSTVRYSKDPVTGHEVDKALAFIIEGAEGEALYFESKETAQKYRKDVKD